MRLIAQYSGQTYTPYARCMRTGVVCSGQQNHELHKGLRDCGKVEFALLLCNPNIAKHHDAQYTVEYHQTGQQEQRVHALRQHAYDGEQQAPATSSREGGWGQGAEHRTQHGATQIEPFSINASFCCIKCECFASKTEQESIWGSRSACVPALPADDGHHDRTEKR